MSNKPDGGPAFPYKRPWMDRSGIDRIEHLPGMSLRDWLAGHAPQLPSYLQDVVPFNTPNPADGDADWRYMWADAMIERRDK